MDHGKPEHNDFRGVRRFTGTYRHRRARVIAMIKNVCVMKITREHLQVRREDTSTV